MSDNCKDYTQDALQKMISPADYRVFAGPDWPSYDAVIIGRWGDRDDIKEEVREFVRMMQENYRAQLTHGDQLAMANQQRQRQIFFSKNYQGSPCQVPWNTMGVNPNGDVFICSSPSWIPKYVGNLLEADDIFAILNSDTARIIRQEILEGRYTFCNHRICNFFSRISPDRYEGQGPEYVPRSADHRPEIMVDRMPANLIFDFDFTCNFRCPSCRIEVINTNNDHVIRPQNDRIAEKIKRLIIDNIQDQPVTIRWCGGEPFISDVYLDLMEYITSHPRATVRHIIQTNGSYLAKKSEIVKKLLPHMESIRVSFDAATADTYHRVRVNGRWDHLIENVKWLRSTIDQVAPSCRLLADFVVQYSNYREIPRFVALCDDLGIDGISWQKMWNWGTWSQKEFDHHNVYNPDHELYQDLIKQFQISGQPMSFV